MTEGNLQQHFGRNLRAVRNSTGLSQAAFADKLGVHRTYLGGLERGERNVTLRTVERLADQLDADALVLLVGPASTGASSGHRNCSLAGTLRRPTPAVRPAP